MGIRPPGCLEGWSDHIYRKGKRGMSKLRKSDLRRQAAFCLIAALLAGILPIPAAPPAQAAGYSVSNPRIENGITT